ncbi:rRNA bioproteinsis protein rrp36 [Puccinia graminis f. sp. tritici]|uniref:rRNA biogenesis protein RRP36 n=1 Tax=Puccinia graminis f. sp. tritici TaxID=56615 RepID=A0A5B0PZP8_PUCGR|nr:rRNA bioproteinsis protein rrp36 [Puccinia graminis f. sp. tritici]KAA1109429.1 rRNA bioproteinsis protein rrp36 [Puccinia graminis f. sp. tritici]
MLRGGTSETQFFKAEVNFFNNFSFVDFCSSKPDLPNLQYSSSLELARMAQPTHPQGGPSSKERKLKMRVQPEEEEEEDISSNDNDSERAEEGEDEEDEDEDEDYGSLTDESEDEWAEERKAIRYIAESELEDNLDSSSDDGDDQSDDPFSEPAARKMQSIGSLIKARQNNKQGMRSNEKKEEEEGTSKQKKKPQESEKSRRTNEMGSSGDEETIKKAYSTRKKSIAQRSHKHAPIEISSKKPVTRKRTIVEVPKIERRDPRFDSLSGQVNSELHERSFEFLKEQRKSELEQLRQTLALAKKKKSSSKLDPDQLEALENHIRKEENKDVQNQKLMWEKQALKEWKSQENAKRKEGKGAFYLKRKAQKEIILTNRYQQLSQNKSKLHKSIEKKRKKVDGKEKKSMPFKRHRPSD